MQKYIFYNGEFRLSNENCINHENRAFRFGDAVFETIRSTGVNLHFFDIHYQRLLTGIKALKIDLNQHIQPAAIQDAIVKLINKNKSFRGNRIRVTVFRDAPSIGYMPESNAPGILIENYPLDQLTYSMNEKGMIITEYPLKKDSNNMFNRFKNSNSLYYTLAGIYKKENNVDDCILLNEKGNICEFISSNIFLVYKNKLYTPPLSDGCLDGVTRKILTEIAVKKGIEVKDNKSLGLAEVYSADEVFATNVIKGISWVVGYRDKRYYNTMAKQLLGYLNEAIIIK